MSSTIEVEAGVHVRMRAAADVTPRPLDPVWDGFLWAGKPTLLAGDPGLGKSLLTVDIAARVSTGEPWPCSSIRREPAGVVMLSAEDDPEDTLVPRLIAAGADLARVRIVEGVTVHDERGERNGWLSLDEHLEPLGQAIAETDARLVIIDPLSAYLGRDTDSHNEGDVRTILAGLAGLATEARVAILAVRHLRKADSNTAQHRIIGSVAFSAAARAVYVVVRDPDDEDRRLLLCAKNNLAVDALGFGYRVEATDAGVPRVAWADQHELRTADEVLGGTSARAQATEAAEAWILETLKGGPIPSRSMRTRAQTDGVAWRTVELARQRLGEGVVRVVRLSFGNDGSGAWHWQLATPQCPTPQVPASNVCGLARDAGNTGLNGSRKAQDRNTAKPIEGGGLDEEIF